jgi:DNA-binding CsgD family transcriptional regulator
MMVDVQTSGSPPMSWAVLGEAPHWAGDGPPSAAPWAVGTSPPHREAPLPGRVLTPRQREVADLAARGWSNRSIARHLFISVRTVENHLYATYRKSGAANRTQLRPAEPSGSTDQTAERDQRGRRRRAVGRAAVVALGVQPEVPPADRHH